MHSGFDTWEDCVTGHGSHTALIPHSSDRQVQHQRVGFATNGSLTRQGLIGSATQLPVGQTDLQPNCHILNGV